MAKQVKPKTKQRGSATGGSGLTAHISSRLSPETKAELLAQAVAARWTVSEWMREAVIKNRTEVVAENPERVAATLRMQALFAKASNNINQVAYRLNSDHLVGKNSDATYRAALVSLEGVERLLLKALTK